MDTYTKNGKVYLQPYKTGKNWKPVWLSLFPSSIREVGRLEIQTMQEVDSATTVKKHHQPLWEKKLKVVQLSKLISVLRLPPNAEACPMENMSAFCVETRDRTLVFAAFKDDCADWVKKLSDSIVQGGGHSASNQLHVEDNPIYDSNDEFWVLVKTTDAATRDGLQGFHWLQVGKESLQLKEIQMKKLVREWPYELLRRYGKDKLALTIEAGRRCDSGPGTFTFETPQAERIFFLIQSTIKEKSSANTTGYQNQECKKDQQTNLASMASTVERDRRTREGKCAGPEDRAHLQGERVAHLECASAQPAPITLLPLPLIPTNDSPFGGHHSGQLDPVYAEPTEYNQSVSKPPLDLYVDPAIVLPLKPPTSRATAPLLSSSMSQPCFVTDNPDSVYSEVYDRVSPVQGEHFTIHSEKPPNSFTDDEPIYAEPLNVKEKVISNTEDTPDPFAHLYAQVCKSPRPSALSKSTPPCSAPSSSVTGNTSETKDVNI